MKSGILPFILFTIVGCAAQESLKKEGALVTIGIVNHTENYVNYASINGVGGGNMLRQGAGTADVCCVNIPKLWYPGMKALVRWDMPDGTEHVFKEKTIEIEKYDRPGSVYIHFFPNDEVRIVVTGIAGFSQRHPIAPPVKPMSL
ncbi:DUF3304 domain-containing protein [Oxalobacteraceae bacterium]|nr:DUF3304 domain-containing protein [Oxalobacteraceae bacterium]